MGLVGYFFEVRILDFRIRNSNFRFRNLLHDTEVILPTPNPTTFDYLLKLEPRERRDGKRTACQLEGQCRPMQGHQVSASWPVTVHNISESGFQLLLSRRFEPGTLLVVDVHDVQGQATRMLLGRVVRVTSMARGRWILGCTFTVPLTPDDLSSLLTLASTNQLPSRKAS